MKFASTILAISLSTVCLGYSMADFTEDGIVDFSDFSVFGNEWLQDPNTLPDNTTRRKTGGGATFVVAASDASATVKARADYICDGTNDEVQIQAAIDALPTTSSNRRGGKILLSEGNFSIGSTIIIGKQAGDRLMMVLEGAGATYATHLNLADNANCSILQIGYEPRKTDPYSTDGAESGWVDLINIHFNGNRLNQSSNTYAIGSVEQGNDKFVITGQDATDKIKASEVIRVYDSTGNDGFYWVKSSTYTGGNTEVVINETPPNTTADGTIKADPPVIDAAAWQDGMMLRCGVENGIGTGLQIKRGWSLYIKDGWIEHNVDAGLLICSGRLGGTISYRGEYVTIRGICFMGDISGTPGSAAVLTLIESGGGVNYKHCIVNNLFSNGCREGVMAKGGVDYVIFSGNQMNTLGWENSNTYYCVHLKANEGNRGPRFWNIYGNGISINEAKGVFYLEMVAAPQPDNNLVYGNSVLGSKPFVEYSNWQVGQDSQVIPTPTIIEHHTSTAYIPGFKAHGGWVFTNVGAGGSVTYYLPESDPGMVLVFHRVAAQDMVLDVWGTQTIDGNFTKTISSGGFTTIRCSEDTKWITE